LEYILKQFSEGVIQVSDINKLMDQVVTKMSFDIIKKEIKPIQMELNKVIERHQKIGGGKLNTQAIILDSFFAKDELLIKEGTEETHYSNLDAFINSIPEEEKVKLYNDTMALFLEKMSSDSGENR